MVIITPGHAANHLCLVLVEDGLLFSGDHILNCSTTIVNPPDGAMKTRPEGTLQDWVELAYADTPQRLWPMALRSLQAHVDRIDALRRAA